MKAQRLTRRAIAGEARYLLRTGQPRPYIRPFGLLPIVRAYAKALAARQELEARMRALAARAASEYARRGATPWKKP